MNEPRFNLFIVGAMKAGTTSFSRLLSAHPSIYFSPIKEPNYFTRDLPSELYEPSRFFSLEKYFNNNFPNPLHIANVKSPDHYNLLTSLWEGQDYLMEASTAYLHAPGVAHRIHEYNKEAKIIILKRDPLQRAFSHYRMQVGLLREVKSFEEVMRDELSLYYSGNLPWYSCLGMSLYNNRIDQFKELFDDVLILNFEDLTNNFENLMNKVENFLSIEPIEEWNLEKVNPSIHLRIPFILRFFKNLGISDIASEFLGERFKSYALKVLRSNRIVEMDLSEHTKSKLQEFFKTES